MSSELEIPKPPSLDDLADLTADDINVEIKSEKVNANTNIYRANFTLKESKLPIDFFLENESCSRGVVPIINDADGAITGYKMGINISKPSDRDIINNVSELLKSLLVERYAEFGYNQKPKFEAGAFDFSNCIWTKEDKMIVYPKTLVRKNENKETKEVTYENTTPFRDTDDNHLTLDDVKSAMDVTAQVRFESAYIGSGKVRLQLKLIACMCTPKQDRNSSFFSYAKQKHKRAVDETPGYVIDQASVKRSHTTTTTTTITSTNDVDTASYVDTYEDAIQDVVNKDGIQDMTPVDVTPLVADVNKKQPSKPRNPKK